ncbi:hypothetical protein EJB05_49617, partial [Eragrostis curvula]
MTDLADVTCYHRHLKSYQPRKQMKKSNRQPYLLSIERIKNHQQAEPYPFRRSEPDDGEASPARDNGARRGSLLHGAARGNDGADLAASGAEQRRRSWAWRAAVEQGVELHLLPPLLVAARSGAAADADADAGGASCRCRRGGCGRGLRVEEADGIHAGASRKRTGSMAATARRGRGRAPRQRRRGGEAGGLQGGGLQVVGSTTAATGGWAPRRRRRDGIHDGNAAVGPPVGAVRAAVGPAFFFIPFVADECVRHCSSLFSSGADAVADALSATAGPKRPPFKASFVPVTDNLRHVFLPKLKTLRDHGVTEEVLVKLVTTHPKALTYESSRFDEGLAAVKDLGVSPSAGIFPYAFGVFAKMYQSKWDRRIKNFLSLGWTEEQVRKAFARHPYCMLASEDKVGQLMRFYAEKLGWTPEDVYSNPVLLSFSYENRVLPRYTVLNLLASTGVIKQGIKVSHLIMTEKRFAGRYITTYQEVFPQILEAYGARTATVV